MADDRGSLFWQKTNDGGPGASYGGDTPGTQVDNTQWSTPGRSAAFGQAVNAGMAGTAQHSAYEWGGRVGAAGEDIQRYRALAEAAARRNGAITDYAGANRYAALGDSARNQQLEAANLYRNAAMGNGPSAAQAQFQQNIDASSRNAMSMASSARGGAMARAAAMRDGMQAAGDANQNAAAQSAMLRAQEQQAAMQGYAGATGQLRGMDLASQQQAAQQSQFQANLEQQNFAQNDEMQRYYASLGHDVSKTAMGGAMARQDAIRNNLAVDQAQPPPGSDYGWLATGAQAVGSVAALAAMSDERVKTDVRSGDRDIKGFLDALSAHNYEYKNAKHGEGRHVSVMAQELEKTPLGKQMVFETKDGKAVDYARGFATMLASQAALNKRLAKLEGGK